MLRLLSVGLLLCHVAASAACAADTAFNITTQHRDDKVEVQEQPNQVTFFVHSPFGISRTKIKRTGAAWPQNVTVRLYLKGLESLKLQADPVRLEAAVSSHDGSMRQWLAGHEEMPLTQEHRYWMPIRMVDRDGKTTTSLPLKDGWFEFKLTHAMLEGNPETIILQWIDFYRN